jgi:hypothetical protein
MSDAEQPKRGRRALSDAQRRESVMKSSYREAEHADVCRAADLAGQKPSVLQRIAAIALARQILSNEQRGVPRNPYGG